MESIKTKYFVNDLPDYVDLKGSIAIDTEAMGLKYNIRDREIGCV